MSLHHVASENDDPQRYAIQHFKIVEGEGLHGGKQVILGKVARENFKRGVGQTIKLYGSAFRVVGIYEKGSALEEEAGVISLTDAQALLKRPHHVTLFQLKLKPRADVERLRSMIERRFPDLSVSQSTDSGVIRTFRDKDKEDMETALSNLCALTDVRNSVLFLIQAASQSKGNRRTILDRLADIIEEQSEIIYSPTPDGLKEGEREKYEEMKTAAIVEQAAIQTVLGILGPDGLLDSEEFTQLIDKTGVLERLGRWQEHITTMRKRAAKVAEEFSVRHQGKNIRKVKIFGLGGSVAPHEIAVEIINNFRKSSTEIEVVHADTPNPDYIDEETLVILSSFSGNTEETINCYETIKHKTNLFVALAKGGKLRSIAKTDNILFIQLPEKETDPAFVMQPRESVCLQMTATLTFLGKIGLRPGSEGEFTTKDLEFEDTLKLIGNWRDRFGPDMPFKDNPAKQLAFFLLYGIDYRGEGELLSYDFWDKRIPFILVDRNNWAIGHEPRTQMHERSKLNAAFYVAPEFLHNLVESIRAALESAEAGLDEDRYVYYFIRSVDEESRIRLRLDKTIELVMQDKANYAVLNVEGDTPYQRALFATYFNAHMTTYLALLNGFDPLPVPTMSWLKKVMREFPRDGEEERAAQTRERPLQEIHKKASQSTCGDGRGY